MGARPHPFRYFEELVRAYSGRSPPELMWTLLRRKEQVAGGLLALFYYPKRTLYLRYLSINRALPNAYASPYYLYWDAVKKASEEGCRIVDFGGTPSNPNDIHYRMKAKFSCRYEKKYMAILPSSRLFKLLYHARTLLQGRGLRRNPKLPAEEASLDTA